MWNPCQRRKGGCRKHGAVESAFVWGSVLTPPSLLEPPLEEPSLLGIAVQPRAPECWHSRAEWGRRGPTRHILEAKKKCQDSASNLEGACDLHI